MSPFIQGRGRLPSVVHLPKSFFVGNYWSNIYSYSYLFDLFYSIYSTYIEWIHVVQIIQIRKFQHQVRVVLCDWLVVIQIPKIQPGSCIGQSKHVGLFWYLSYWEIPMQKFLGNVYRRIWYM